MTDELIPKLIANLSSLIKADHIILGRLMDKATVKTEYVYANGEYLENFSYSLKGTPCEEVISNKYCTFPHNIAEKFPEDEILKKMGVRAYLGIPIENSNGEVVAILVALYKVDIDETKYRQCLMESFSLSISAEFSRYKNMIQVEEIKEDLKEQVLRLEQQQDILNQAQRIAKFASYEIDIEAGKVNWSKGVENILYIDVNLEQYSNFNGISIDEAWMEYIDKKDRAAVSKGLALAIEKAEPYRIQYTACLPDGSNKLMLTEGKPIKDSTGRVKLIRGFLQDISELNAVQIELINREKRLVSLFDNSPLGIIEWNLDFTIKDWNIAAEKIFGWSKAEVLDKVGDFILPEEVKVDVSKIWQDLINGKGGLHNINGNRTKSGKSIIVEWRNASLYGANNEVISIVSYVEDITKKHQEEELTKQLEEKFSTIFSASQDAITVTRKETGEFVDVNEGFERITGYSRQDAIGQTSISLNLVDEENRSAYLKEIFEKGHISNVEQQFRSKSGEEIFGIYSAKTVTINNEDLIIAYCHDITERKKSAQQIALHRDNLQYLIEIQTKDLVDAKNEAVQANRYKSEFLANMSHEIRTPMNAITGLTYLTLQTKLDERQKDYLLKIDTSAKNLLLLINDILDFSKVESGHLKIDPEPFRIDELLENVTDLIRDKANEKGLELIIHYPSNIPLMLIGDSLRLSQVLTNLASNAVKFTDAGFVKIKVDLKHAEDNNVELLFSVMDTGIGMSMSAVKNLFKPFEQADGSITRRFGGTGLGLSISQSLVGLMEGEITARSILHQGTEFEFTLKFPIAEENHTYKEDCDGLENKKILIVEDNQSAQEIITEILMTLGMQVTTVDSAESAMDVMQENIEFDLVLLDWKLPMMNGLDCAKVIHEKYKKSLPALIMVTGFSKEDVGNQDDLDCLDYFLVKPITPLLLIKTLKKALGIASTSISDSATSMVDIASIAGARVLLVEDNPINQQVASELLRMRSVNTTIARNGAQALDKIKEDDFDIIFMDLQMPIMDGYSAAEIISQDPKYQHIPIIAMTAHALQSDQEHCLNVGMKGHILKPIVIDDIDRALVKWISPREGIGSAYIKNHEAQELSSDYKGFPDSIVGLDLDLGLSLVAGNKNVYLNLLADFSRRYKHVVEQLSVDIGMNNKDYIHDIAHTLTSAAGNLGATDLSKVAVTLDSQLQEGTLDPLICNAMCQRLSVLIESIDTWQDANRYPEKVEENQQLNPSFITLLTKEEEQQLTNYLADDNTAAVDLINNISQRLKGQSNKDLSVIMDLIEGYDFPEALQQYNQLCHDHNIVMTGNEVKENL